MRFAFCLFRYFPFGGLQRDCLQVLRECRSRGHTVDLYAGSWEGPVPDDVSLKQVDAAALSNHAFNTRFAQRVHPPLAAGGYDAVVGFNKMPGLDLYYAGDVCLAERLVEASPLKKLLPRYRTLLTLERAVFGAQTDTDILLLAASQQADYAKHYATSPERFRIMPPDMPPDRVYTGDLAAARLQARERLGVSQNGILLLMVGSGFKAKGLDRSIRALAALPEALRMRAELRVVGQDKPAAFNKLAEQLGVGAQLRFDGGKDDLQPYYLAADALLHPAYHEMTGTVLLEAMGHGLPVLTTAACGYAAHVAEAQGGVVLALPFSQEGLNEMLVAMLRDPRDRGERGLAYVRRMPLGLRPKAAADAIEHRAARKGLR